MKVLVTGGAGYIGSHAMRALQKAGTYGVPQQQLICEDQPSAPINPYSASKLMVERLLTDFGRAYGLRSAIFRYFNATRAVTGRELSVVSAERREGDPPVLVASSAKACAELGWTPQYRELAVILQHAWAWHQRRLPSPVGNL